MSGRERVAVNEWRISLYDVRPGAGGFALPPGPPRFVYVRDGRARAGEAALGAGEGRFVPAGTVLSGAGTLWLYEGGPGLGLLEHPSVALVLSRTQALEPGPRLLRADRIESGAGSQTPRHCHRGPGIRRMLFGSILGEIGPAWDRFDAGHAWFERGSDPVIGRNVHTGNSAFVRFLVLPPELAGGKTSFVATDAVEAAKPRGVQNAIFGEVTIP